MESNIPTKKIKSSEDLKFWFTSDAYYYLTQWIRLLSLKIKDLKNTQECKISDTVQNILNILDQLSNLIDKTPPDNQPTRFGNKAYRTWTNKLLKVFYFLLFEFQFPLFNFLWIINNYPIKK
eukprot:Anaeramoba_flamelloidesc42105_g1_i9.p1 GENE.c42105_g1_i9~~c42105_g1_i9.p1  ORF type:complete len:131 (+),score=17.90 c42105_g1_i9:28-393(+)